MEGFGISRILLFQLQVPFDHFVLDRPIARRTPPAFGTLILPRLRTMRLRPSSCPFP